jgi:26S proteasome regulatory subunit T1
MFLRPTRRLGCCSSTRWLSHQPHNPPPAEVTSLLSQYASTAPLPLNLSQLLSFGRPVTSDSVLSSVSYVLYELPRRLATRVRHMEALPFIVGTNPYVARTLKSFRESFYLLATHPPVTNLRENDNFSHILSDLVERHANDIPTMAKGYVPVALQKGRELTGRALDSRNAQSTCPLKT